MKFHILVYGCQMNYSDSARIRAMLMTMGREDVDDVSGADIVILDTCSVRQKSEDKITGKLQEIRSDQKIWMTGCMVQHYLRNSVISKATKGKISTNKSGNFLGNISISEPYIVGLENDLEDKLKNISTAQQALFVNNAYNPLRFTLHKEYDNLELFRRIDDTGYLPYICRELGYDVSPDIGVIDEYSSIIPHDSNMLMSSGGQTAFVPISTGCNQFCAYCIVPYARGLEKDRPASEVIDEARSHISQGITEITLLGQIVNKHPDFTYICKEICKISGLHRLRFTSPYPTYFDEDFFHLLETEPKLCPHIHMPLQSGSDKILKKMFRGYTSEEFMGFVDKVRSLDRGISITTDIIVGFPDETEEDFEQSMKLTEYSRFDMIYIGIYSPRPGTIAARKYIDNIPKTIKKDRRSRLNNLLTNISTKNNMSELGMTKDVMITAKLKNGKYIGYTDNMKNCVVDSENLDPQDIIGKIHQVQIIDSKAFKLFGKLI